MATQSTAPQALNEVPPKEPAPREAKDKTEPETFDDPLSTEIEQEPPRHSTLRLRYRGHRKVPPPNVPQDFWDQVEAARRAENQSDGCQEEEISA